MRACRQTYGKQCQRGSRPGCAGCRRRGVALLLALLAVTVATMVAYSFVSAQSTTISISRNVTDQLQARYIAESGLRLAIAYIDREPDWRDDQSNGTWVSDYSIAGGTFTVVGEDGEDTDGDGVISQMAEGDGDLADDAEDLLTLTATGKFGATSHIARVVVRPEPSSSIYVLMVVPDADAPDAEDALKKAKMESYDFDVEMISADDSQAEFDDAVADANVAYISETVSSGDLGLKLKNATIGIVNELQDITDEYGFSSSNICHTSTMIDVTDNTHYITETFNTGNLPLITAGGFGGFGGGGAEQMLHTAHGTMGGGAVVLAERPLTNNASLVVIDTGDALFGGGTAAGRRVHLPWGCNDYDPDRLGNSGWTIMRRAIEWAATGVDAGLLAHWKLDDGGGTTATDSSGNGYAATLTNMDAGSDWVAGTIDGALDFDGSNDYLEIAGFPDLTGDFTVTAWIRPNSTSGDQRIYCDDEANGQGFGLSLGDGGSGRLRFFSRNVSPIELNSSAAVATGTWQFVAGVHDAAAKQRRMYVGATMVGSDTGSYTGTWGTDAGPASIGGEVDGTSEGVAKWRFGGQIDDVRVYDRVLSADEIAELASGSAGSTTTYTYTVAWVQ